jgi:hypothetical protein
MKNNHDILFKAGIALQALLIPIAFLWKFGPEGNYYNWVVTICSLLVVVLCFWPQAVVVRLKRLKAIKVQFIVVASLLAVSWFGYAYLYGFTRANCNPSTYALQQDSSGTWQEVTKESGCAFSDSHSSGVMYNAFGWLILLGSGISVPTAALLTVTFGAMPTANLYKYTIDKKRFKGIKKDDLFV